MLRHPTPTPAPASTPAPAFPAAGSGTSARGADGIVRRLGPLAVVSLLGAAAAVLAVLLAPPGPARLLCLLVFLSTGPGAAVVCHQRPRDPVVAWSLVVVGSWAVTAALASLMVWAGAWHPQVALGVLTTACAASSAARLGVPRVLRRAA